MDKDTFSVLLDSLANNSKNWKRDIYCFTYDKGWVEIWVSGGFFSYSLHRPFKIKFTFLQKLKIHKAIGKNKINRRKMEAQKIKELLTK